MKDLSTFFMFSGDNAGRAKEAIEFWVGLFPDSKIESIEFNGPDRPDPAGHVPLLREYVEQGGRLVIAAGASFDPAAWTREAWQEGAGILPLPLAAEPLGEVPEAASGSLEVFQLSFESLAGEDYFQLAGVGEAELRDLFSEPFFFKAAELDDAQEQDGHQR